MSGLAGSARGADVGAIEGDGIAQTVTRKCEEVRAVVADAGLYANKVRPEAIGESALDEKNVCTAQLRRRDLPVCSSVHAGRVDNLAVIAEC